MLIIRIVILFLICGTSLQAKYYKCFYLQNNVIDYSNSIALFIEDHYISVMDNVYHVNAQYISAGHDSAGDFTIYKKEAKDFLYMAKLYKDPMTMILTRKNLIDNKMFQDTSYACKNPDTMQDIPVIITKAQ
ncbi:MAG: hypothetical protein LBQ34_02850 [Alphaproteobacteria bacterium]|jgi:hypothetical protein|nr:hypothetical protein [Alphaproteobacteria bacterium]